MPSSAGKLRYSPMEQSILALLPDDGTKVSSEQIVELHYGKRKRPFNARKIIIGVLRGLIQKSNRNRESFKIHKSARKGPYPIMFWIERRNA